MNGIHDLGGMDGFGSVPYPGTNEVFHERWHGETYATLLATLANGIAPIDEFRHSIERIPPDLYLQSTYYDRWVTAMARLYIERGVIDPETFVERTAAIEAGRADVEQIGDSEPFDPGAYSWIEEEERADTAPGTDSDSPAFEVGDRVVVRNVHPDGHTRCPRYVRRARGVIEADRGLEPFPDARADGRDASERLYQVGFDGEELWGDDAEPGLYATLDLWEPYLRLADSSN